MINRSDSILKVLCFCKDLNLSFYLGVECTEHKLFQSEIQSLSNIYGVYYVIPSTLVKDIIGLRLSPSPETAGLAAGEATLFRLAGLSEEPESRLKEVGRERILIFIFEEKSYKSH